MLNMPFLINIKDMKNRNIKIIFLMLMTTGNKISLNIFRYLNACVVPFSYCTSLLKQNGE